jgi:LPXTG-motif cell wall-anchored protein
VAPVPVVAEVAPEVPAEVLSAQVATLPHTGKASRLLTLVGSALVLAGAGAMFARRKLLA